MPKKVEAYMDSKGKLHTTLASAEERDQIISIEEKALKAFDVNLPTPPYGSNKYEVAYWMATYRAQLREVLR